MAASQSVQEQYQAYPIAANGTQVINSGTGTGNVSTAVGGFLCTTAGNITVAKGLTGAGATIIAVYAVTAGAFYPMPFTTSEASAVVLSGGAAGTLFMI